MTINDKYVRLIDSLLLSTKSARFVWHPIWEVISIGANPSFDRYLINYNRYLYSGGNHPIIDEYNSYYCEIGKGNVFLLRITKGDKVYYIVAIQVRKNMPYEINNDLLLQSNLSDLYEQIVIAQREDSTNDYIDQIINMAAED